MKRLIYSSNRIEDNLFAIESQLKGLKYNISPDKDEIEIAMPPGAREDELMQEPMLGKWFADRGFDVSFRKGDFEYQTKPDWINYKAIRRSKPHTAYLRNRLIMMIR